MNCRGFGGNEYEKYRVVQDRMIDSDFDIEVKKLQKRRI